MGIRWNNYIHLEQYLSKRVSKAVSGGLREQQIYLEAKLKHMSHG